MKQKRLINSLLVLVLKLSASFLSVLLSIIISRTLSLEQAGYYFFSYAILFVVGSLARCGLDHAVVRVVASNLSKDKYEVIFNYYILSIALCLLISSLFSFSGVFFSSYLANLLNKPVVNEVIYFLSFLIPPYALILIHSMFFQGLGKIKTGIFFQTLIFPLGALLGVLLFVPIYAVQILKILFFILFLGLVIAKVLWFQNFKDKKIKIYPVKYFQYFWNETRRSCPPLFAMLCMNLVVQWLGQIGLGLWASPESVALYSAASKVAMVCAIMIASVNSISAPKYAVYAEQQDYLALKQEYFTSTKLICLIAIPTILILMIFSEPILGIFGEGYANASVSLRILAVGQFLNSITGSVGYILVMSGNEATMRNNVFFASILSIVLGVSLIPAFGIIGAAVTTSIALSVQNIFAAYHVSKIFGIRFWPF